ncbi:MULTISPECIES: condensation domain-containing protein [unclassified Streptomyces]|uniref:condensation domain-containing protein n=1 Tax=unclassified Streptomyces TaxID=2593676 RepID=UPI003804CEB7
MNGESVTEAAAERQPAPGELKNWLAAQWAELLGAQPQDDADFFALGGSSLQATILTSRIRQAGFPHIGLVDVLEHRSFARQLTLVASQDGRDRPAPHSPPTATTTPPGLSHGQRNRLAMARERLLAGEGGAPPLAIQLAVELLGPVDVPALEAAVRDLVVRHVGLRTAFLTADGEIQLREVPPELLDGPYLTIRDLRHHPSDTAWSEALALAQEQVSAPVDFREPPLVSTHLTLLSEDRHLFTLTVDHLVSDATSAGLLWRDLAEFYEASLENRPPGLPPLRTTAQQVLGAREAQWRAGETHMLDAWDKALAGFPYAPQDDLAPVDAAEEFRPPQPAEFTRFTLPAQAATDFESACLTTGVTRHTAVMGLVFHALHALDGRQDAVVCSSQSGRTDVQDDLVGWLSDSVIVRIGGQDGGLAVSALELVRRTQERLMFAYRNPVPFNVLVQRYQGTVDGRTPYKPHIYVHHTGDSPVGARFGATRAQLLDEHASVTFFPGPSVQVEQDGDDLSIGVNTAAGRYPDGLANRFGALLRDAIIQFTAEAAA